MVERVRHCGEGQGTVGRIRALRGGSGILERVRHCGEGQALLEESGTVGMVRHWGESQALWGVPSLGKWAGTVCKMYLSKPEVVKQ